MLTHPEIVWLIHTDLDVVNRYGTKMSPRDQTVFLAEPQPHVINPANLCRALDDGVEDRLHICGRAADDAEHLGRRRLMVQRLAQLRVALAEFLEQADVFDGDDGLIGEGFKKFDLFFCERSHFQPAYEN